LLLLYSKRELSEGRGVKTSALFLDTYGVRGYHVDMSKSVKLTICFQDGSKMVSDPIEGDDKVANKLVSDACEIATITCLAIHVKGSPVGIRPEWVMWIKADVTDIEDEEEPRSRAESFDPDTEDDMMFDD
jgi:hypothetical protein